MFVGVVGPHPRGTRAFGQCAWYGLPCAVGVGSDEDQVVAGGGKPVPGVKWGKARIDKAGQVVDPVARTLTVSVDGEAQVDPELGCTVMLPGAPGRQWFPCAGLFENSGSAVTLGFPAA